MTTAAAHKPQDNFRADVKKRLVDLELSVTGLARRLRVSRNGVSQAIHHPVNPKVRRKIERFLDLTHTEAKRR